MALDFYIFTGCALQDEWEPRSLIQEAKLRAMLEMLDANREQIERQQGLPLEEISITMQYACRGETLDYRKMTVAEIRQAWEQTETKAHPICPDCPANWRGRSVGCFAAISYPISAAGEQWLVDHFNPPLGDQDELLRAIIEDEMTGEDLDDNRPQSEDDRPGLLAAPAPACKCLAQNGLEITSSQLIQAILAFQPALNPRLLFSLCTSFGAVELEPAEVKAIAAHLEEQYHRPQQKQDDFFGGGALSIMGQGQDGQAFRMVFGGSGDPADEDEEDTPNSTIQDETLGQNAGMVTSFELKPPIRLPKGDADWLKDRLKDVPFLLRDEEGDDGSISQIKRFLYAAWQTLQERALLVIDG